MLGPHTDYLTTSVASDTRCRPLPLQTPRCDPSSLLAVSGQDTVPDYANKNTYHLASLTSVSEDSFQYPSQSHLAAKAECTVKRRSDIDSAIEVH